MVKIYLKDNKNEYVSVSIWSLVKANFLSSLIIYAITYGIALLILIVLETIGV